MHMQTEYLHLPMTLAEIKLKVVYLCLMWNSNFSAEKNAQLKKKKKVSMALDIHFTLVILCLSMEHACPIINSVVSLHGQIVFMYSETVADK